MTVVGSGLKDGVWLRGLHWSPNLDTAIQRTAQQVALQNQSK